MSYQAQTWVDEHGVDLCKNGGEAFVLVRIANHTGPGMRGCYASAGSIARLCKMGRSTVLKHIRELVARGVLLPGDPALTEHLPADKRPPVYDLVAGHDAGCVGTHTIRDDCRPAAGVQIEHPQDGPRRAGARSEHPKKKRRSAGVRSEHPEQGDGGAGVQIDPERVLKSSTNSSKELKVPLSEDASAEAVGEAALADVAEDVNDERETDASREDNEQARAAESFAATLPGRLGRATVRSLAPLVVAAFADGYTVETLQDELAERVNVPRIANRSALPTLYARALKDLPAAPAPRSNVADIAARRRRAELPDEYAL
ncbi:helix-turn-helix domain-containing protein [Streptomyces sp. NPDC057496]|uniref:helix-turn-helix domain-containing protein n=1 Tax=Streptomyces sp. NPDC057496 TaxID=3346149 RepID=UPI003694D4E3